MQEQLNITEFPKVECKKYDKILKRLNPKSVTLVFPSAHINSPASMFGHTFLRINSGYNSKLLSFAINYAADANPNKTNGVTFAIKGLTGGYFGKYSLLPYYEKLKEYRDTEQRDIWEYDLNLNEKEVLKMVQHIWELNNTHSYYYFFTENCSYNMLWFIESARPSINLRKYFNYQVLPLETVHVAKEEGLIVKTHYRASKRTKILEYEQLIDLKYIYLVKDILNSKIKIETILENKEINKQQKRYILEVSIELLEYSFTKNDMQKEEFIKLFHTLSKARATLGLGKKLTLQTPNNPLDSHRSIKISSGVSMRDKTEVGLLGIRPAYHGLDDSSYGFLRGTQIEFLNLALLYSDKKIAVDSFTLLSIASFAQSSLFIDAFSWRMRIGFDRNSSEEDDNSFIGTLGSGFSWGNKYGYTYIMIDPFLYGSKELSSAIGGSVGVVIDSSDFMHTNMELTKHYYDNGEHQLLMKFSQNFRTSQNTQVQFKYDYKKKFESFGIFFNYYF
ncbi:MAG: DUF4105 domain-containing protein [Campylobacterota bacterium]|nr:DUF4105 domain-containing protein [Campylobacterota bacterium]